MASKERVLVTGGSGLVGKAIEQLVSGGGGGDTSFADLDVSKYTFVFASSRDADLTSDEQTGALFIKHKPNYVVNLAAKVGGLYANMRDNSSFYRVNKSINENVLRWSHKVNAKKCISCLSTCIFPDGIELPLDESKIHRGPPHESNWGYSQAKREVDLLNRKYNRLAGGKCLFTAIIPTNVFGKHDNFSLEHSHVVPGLVHKAYLSATKAQLEGSPSATLEVCGSGRALRQFVYALDLARLILWTLERYNDPEPVILSPDESDELSIGQVARAVCLEVGGALGVKVECSFEGDASNDGQLKKTASNKKLRRLYPGFRFTPFQEGIREVVEWFCASYPNVRA